MVFVETHRPNNNNDFNGFS